ncbi:YbhB/YbcL family Raf kinase inhibitor-like protein [Rappaport israeli]|uniref:YbhB/YbcL family Raf kinase inhibitor-like protein n=1 Tax=Rappaport israeli TaxID=1839807 RepID=UPI000AFB323F|nr:YbhB/YbcL family Raf kinase inhibitor-like protein [Rappaport israeli]
MHQAPTMTLKSPSIEDGQTLPNTHVYNQNGYNGANRSPALSWHNAPENTQSFALSIYDPDAPTGSGFWHWYLINLPANCHSLPENAGNPEAPNLPDSARQMRNDLSEYGFVGAFPPKGDKPHRYIITVYALDIPKLELPDNATTAFAGFNVLSHTIAQASLSAYYSC